MISENRQNWPLLKGDSVSLKERIAVLWRKQAQIFGGIISILHNLVTKKSLLSLGRLLEESKCPKCGKVFFTTNYRSD